MIVTLIMIVFDTAWHDFYLHRFTYEVDAEAVLASHMETCTEIFFIIVFGLTMKYRKQIASNLLIWPLLPVFLFVIIDLLYKLYIISYFKLSMHPLTILSLLLGVFSAAVQISVVYIITLYFPQILRKWLFQALFAILIVITILDSIYFKYTENHIQSVVFSNINFASIKGAVSGVNPLYYLIFLFSIAFLSTLTVWADKCIVSISKFRAFLFCLISVLAITLIFLLKLNTKCIALDRDLGENFGTIYVRLEKTRQKYRDLLKVSPVTNLVQALYSDIKNDENISNIKPYITYSKNEKWQLESLGLLKSESVKYNNNKQQYSTIVLIVFESLHSDFIHFSNMTIPREATPFIDTLLESYPHLDNYFTSSIPTTPGLNATFLSQLFLTPEFSLKFHRESLFSLLSQKGLDGYFVSGVSGDHQDERRLYPKLFRINNYIAKEELDTRYRGSSGWGYHDDIVLQEGLRILKQRKGQATFLVLKLIDLHQPGEYSGIPEDKLPSKLRDLKDNVVSALYWEDSCMKNFFNEVKESGLFNNETLYVLTSDHGPMLGSQALARPENRRGLSKIPLILISPNIKPFTNLNSKRFASQIDLAPTLLSIMGVDAPTAFLGNSVLSDSSGFALGLLDGKLYYTSEAESFVTSVPTSPVENDVRSSAVNKFLNNKYSEDIVKNSH